MRGLTPQPFLYLAHEVASMVGEGGYHSCFSFPGHCVACSTSRDSSGRRLFSTPYPVVLPPASSVLPLTVCPGHLTPAPEKNMGQ